MQENTQTHPNLHAVLQDKHTLSSLPWQFLSLMPLLAHTHRIAASFVAVLFTEGPRTL